MFRRAWAMVGGLPVAVALTSGPLAAGLAAALSRRPDVVEAVWGERVSRWAAMAVGTVTGLLPLSVAELGAVTVPVLLLAVVVRRWVGARAFLRALPSRLVQAAAVGSVGYAIFLLVWGIGAHRRPLGETLGYDVRPAAFEELTGLYVELVDRTNALRAQVPEVDGVSTTLGDARDVLRRAVDVYAVRGRRWPLVAGRYAPPKPVLLSRGMSAVGILGIYVPFTGEPNVDVDAPAFALPFAACHEMAHQRGFTREDEANYVAWLVAGDDEAPVDFRYSASLNAQIYVATALAQADYAEWQRLHARVAPGVLADVQAWSEWTAGSRTRAADVAAAVNDSYLRSQGANGMQSYGEVVDLLLAERRGRVR